MREMSVTEQRYNAVLAVIGDGRTVIEVSRDWGVSRRAMHRWLVLYEGDGLEGLNNRSHRPPQSPHQMPPAVEAIVLEMVVAPIRRAAPEVRPNTPPATSASSSRRVGKDGEWAVGFRVRIRPDSARSPVRM